MPWNLYLCSVGTQHGNLHPTVTYFILLAYTGTAVSHSLHRKNSGEVWGKMLVNGSEG